MLRRRSAHANRFWQSWREQDEPSLRRSLRTTVSASGFTDVTDVSAGNDAIDVAARTDPDLIVLDVDLIGSEDAPWNQQGVFSPGEVTQP